MTYFYLEIYNLPLEDALAVLFIINVVSNLFSAVSPLELTVAYSYMSYFIVMLY